VYATVLALPRQRQPPILQEQFDYLPQPQQQQQPKWQLLPQPEPQPGSPPPPASPTMSAAPVRLCRDHIRQPETLPPQFSGGYYLRSSQESANPLQALHEQLHESWKQMQKRSAQVSQDLLRVPPPGWKPPPSTTASKPPSTLQRIATHLKKEVTQPPPPWFEQGAGTSKPAGRGGPSQIKVVSIFQTNIPHICTLYLITICILSLLTISVAAIENNAHEQIIVFDEIGKMASSMAYLHVAIPLNISTFEQQISIFHTYLTTLTEATTASAKQVPFTKAIRDLAAFAKSRLSTLHTSLRFIDTILPEDTLHSVKSHNKRFVGIIPLMLYTLIKDIAKQQASYDRDLFFPQWHFEI
jgi:hypothetical protein